MVHWGDELVAHPRQVAHQLPSDDHHAGELDRASHRRRRTNSWHVNEKPASHRFRLRHSSRMRVDLYGFFGVPPRGRLDRLLPCAHGSSDVAFPK